MSARNNREIVTKRDVTRRAVAMEQLNKHVSAEANTCNNRRTVFWRTLPRAYKNDRGDRLRHLSFETSACQNMSLGAEKLNLGI
jgi:hypothetical protein